MTVVTNESKPMSALRLIPPPCADAELEAPQPVASLCPRCDGSGLIHGPGWTSSPCECRERAIRQHSLEQAIAALPPRARLHTRDSWDAHKSPWPFRANLLAEWPARKDGELLRPWVVGIIGPRPGTGKTHAATALYLAALTRLTNPAAALWISAADAARRVAEEVQARIAADRAHREYDGPDTKLALHEAPLVLLDDIGRERASEATRALIVSALMHRHAYVLPTILTGNQAQMTDFHAYDPALTSRLSEDSEIVTSDSAIDQRPPARRRA